MPSKREMKTHKEIRKLLRMRKGRLLLDPLSRKDIKLRASRPPQKNTIWQVKEKEEKNEKDGPPDLGVKATSGAKWDRTRNWLERLNARRTTFDSPQWCLQKPLIGSTLRRNRHEKSILRSVPRLYSEGFERKGSQTTAPLDPTLRILREKMCTQIVRPLHVAGSSATKEAKLWKRHMDRVKRSKSAGVDTQGVPTTREKAGPTKRNAAKDDVPPIVTSKPSPAMFAFHKMDEIWSMKRSPKGAALPVSSRCVSDLKKEEDDGDTRAQKSRYPVASTTFCFEDLEAKMDRVWATVVPISPGTISKSPTPVSPSFVASSKSPSRSPRRRKRQQQHRRHTRK